MNKHNCDGCLRKGYSCLLYQERMRYDLNTYILKCPCNECILKCNCTKRCYDFFEYALTHSKDSFNMWHYKANKADKFPYPEKDIYRYGEEYEKRIYKTYKNDSDLKGHEDKDSK